MFDPKKVFHKKGDEARKTARACEKALRESVRPVLQVDKEYLAAYEDCSLADNAFECLKKVWVGDLDHDADFRAHWFKNASLYLASSVWRAVYKVEHFERGKRSRKESGERLADSAKHQYLGRVWIIEQGLAHSNFV